MDLIKRKDSKYEEYEALLLLRDQRQKEAASIWISYVQTFGQLIADVYEKKVACVKSKKMIAFYQTAVNHGGVVDPDAMQAYINREMAEYYNNLRKLREDNDRCGRAGVSSDYEVARAKMLYRKLAKLLHPDINPETDRREELQELWQRIVEAYGKNDVRALTELEVLTRKALKELGEGEIRVEIPDLDDRIEALRAEIALIENSEPYTYGTLLDSPEEAAEKKAALQKELEAYTKYESELADVLDHIVASGGITFQWRMN